MGAKRTPRSRWIDEGLRALAEGGPDAVRVEVIAKTLGVTKGGFYGYFADRDALLAAMLDAWERAAVDAVLDRVEQDGGDPRAQIVQAGALTLSPELLPLDLAIRDWARRDETVAARLRRVDNRRMDLLREKIGTFCSDPVEVEARSLLAFCLRIGEHFLAVEHTGGTRDEVRARAADLVLKRPPYDDAN